MKKKKMIKKDWTKENVNDFMSSSISSSCGNESEEVLPTLEL